jgi:glutathione peroxidase
MKNYKLILILLLFLINFRSSVLAENMTIINAHQFSFKSIDNKEINLMDFKGKVILIVNTASKCGLTPQYNELTELQDEYKNKGLIIIGVPSADFANQEFSQISKIKEFTNKEFQINFPLTIITKVKGGNAHPFYVWANSKAGFIGSPKWNFHKYLIDKNGNLSAWFSSATTPKSTKIINKIDELIQ